MQKIKCSVYDCKFCDVMKDMCNLKKIRVACCNGKNEKESTMCDSYEKTELD